MPQLWRTYRPDLREITTDLVWKLPLYRDVHSQNPFYNSELTAGEFLIAFILYADTLLSINQIAPLLDHAYNTIHDGIRRMETAFKRSFPTVWERIDHTIDGPTQVDETSKYARDSKDKIRRGKGCPAADHPKMAVPAGWGSN